MTTLETMPGPLLTYKDQQSFGVIAGKSQVEVAPKYGGDPFKEGDIIRLELPAQAFLNPDEFYIQLRARVLPGDVPSGSVKDAGGADISPDSRIMKKIRPGNWKNNLGTTDRDGKHVRFVPGIQCLFDRVKLLVGTEVIEDIQDYNVLYRMMLESTTTPEWRNGEGFLKEGYYDPKDPVQTMKAINRHTAINGKDKNDGHYYTLRPLLGLLNTGKSLPLKLIGQFTIELYLANNKDVLWSSSSIKKSDWSASPTLKQYAGAAGIGTMDTRLKGITETVTAVLTSEPPNLDKDTAGTANNMNHFAVIHTKEGVGGSSVEIVPDFPNAYYELDRVRMQVPFIHPIEQYQSAMTQSVEENGLDIYFQTFSSHTRQIPNASGDHWLSFQERSLYLKGGLCCMRNSNTLRAIDTDSFHFAANGIQEYQWRMGSEYIPAQPVKCGEGAAMAMSQLQKAVGSFGQMESSSNISHDDFLPSELPGERESQNASELLAEVSQPSKFMFGIDLDKSPGQLSGMDTQAAAIDVELRLNLKAHHEVKGGSDNKVQRGAASHVFQPIKVKVLEDFKRCGDNMSEDGMVYTTGAKLDLADPETVRLKMDNHRGGYMHTKDLTCSFTENSGLITNIAYASGANIGNQYARVHFFAHINAILRLRRVGEVTLVK